MRGTFISMCVVLAALVTLGVYSMRFQMDSMDVLDDIRIEAIENVKAGDIRTAREQLVILANEFKKRSHILQIFGSHEDLHDAYGHIVDAQISLECDDMDDTYQALAQLGEALGHIREQERFSIENLY